MQTAMQRLSSGLRINSARDDAAGLAISERMTSQIKGLNQAVRNANDGISLAQTAEGALQESTNILQRMRELSVQSANDTNSASDRANLQKEVSQLQAELNRIADTTSFNGKTVLDGTFTSGKFHVGAEANQTISVSIGSARADAMGNQTLATDGSATVALAAVSGVATAQLAANSTISGGADLIISGSIGKSTALVAAGDSAKTIAAVVNQQTEKTGVTADAVTKLRVESLNTAGSMTFELYGSNTTAVNIAANLSSSSDLTTIVAEINNNQAETGITAELSVDKASFTLTSEAGDDIIIGNAALNATGAFSVQGLNSDGTSASAAVTISTGSDTTRVQGDIDFDSAEIYSVTAEGAGGLFTTATANASSLDKISKVDISTQSGSNKALDTIDGALQFIANTRADLGAVQNRFGSTISNLENVSQNVAAARSRIQDADFAQESSALAKNQILQQAGISLLAQANASTQSVLSLLQ
jgi:flagellin